MAIPNYQEFMLPTLEVIADGQEHKNSEVAQAVAKILNITDEDMQEIKPPIKYGGLISSRTNVSSLFISSKLKKASATVSLILQSFVKKFVSLRGSSRTLL